ncbi:intraflagellar transport protein 81 homolog isoform X1 [Cydia pomonella]|uniref:intraflagellar transport protein 81 homolog isoform X1 n=1 Tax=Cydia pomonella TaxID=82600 RepID=UPI002ADDA4DF|nr:intraflagellar transport protein 81 homolog isoform X1 [Cydia pomonella]
MTEQIKFIVKEINASLGRKYDLIKFDALDEKQLLQLLVDLLVAFNAGEKLDVRDDDPETVSVRLLEMLGSVKYRPPAGEDPPRFRALLLAGDANTVHHVLYWLLANKEHVTNTAYLAKYLKIPDIPTDVARNNTIQDLLDLYQNLIDEFKEVHKRTRMLQNENASEIINDIKEMAVERDIVIKRLENVQVNLIDVGNKEELMNISKALRVQQEMTSTLEHQYETQQAQLKAASDQLKRYLNVIHGQSAAPKTVNDVIKRLNEEIQLNSYLVKEKLPQEAAHLQKELNIMQTIAMEQHPTRSDLMAVQDKIAVVNSEIEQLVQRRLASSTPQEDKLAPFRQQAAVIRRNKDASAARADELAASLREYEATLADLQSQVRQLLGDTILRGEELKKYVNTLRTKSTIYKRQRANLSTFKVEAGILTRTLHVLSAADPTVELALVNHKKTKIEDDDAAEKELKPADLEKKSLHDLSQLVAQTAQKLSQVRQEIQPLADKIKPIKEQFQSVQQQYDQKKRVYEATSINITSQMEPFKNQVKELTDQLNSKEEEWKNLRQKITKAESLQEVVMFEMKNSMQSPRRPSKTETLMKKVADMEQIVKNLEDEQKVISSRQGVVEEQTRLWENTLELLRCKLRARTQPSARQGRMHITQHSQMLTLT